MGLPSGHQHGLLEVTLQFGDFPRELHLPACHVWLLEDKRDWSIKIGAELDLTWIQATKLRLKNLIFNP